MACSRLSERCKVLLSATATAAAAAALFRAECLDHLLLPGIRVQTSQERERERERDVSCCQSTSSSATGRALNGLTTDHTVQVANDPSRFEGRYYLVLSLLAGTRDVAQVGMGRAQEGMGRAQVTSRHGPGTSRHGPGTSSMGRAQGGMGRAQEGMGQA